MARSSSSTICRSGSGQADHLYSAETRGIDITESDPVQGRIVRAANVQETRPLRA